MLGNDIEFLEGDCESCPEGHATHCVNLFTPPVLAYDNGNGGEFSGSVAPGVLALGSSSTYTVSSWIVDGVELITTPTVLGPYPAGGAGYDAYFTDLANLLNSVDPNGLTWFLAVGSLPLYHYRHLRAVVPCGVSVSDYGTITSTRSWNGKTRVYQQFVGSKPAEVIGCFERKVTNCADQGGYEFLIINPEDGLLVDLAALEADLGVPICVERCEKPLPEPDPNTPTCETRQTRACCEDSLGVKTPVILDQVVCSDLNGVIVRASSVYDEASWLEFIATGDASVLIEIELDEEDCTITFCDDAVFLQTRTLCDEVTGDVVDFNDYENPDGTILTLGPYDTGTTNESDALGPFEKCECMPVDCVESQEWTYGIDNTGTTHQWADADYKITLSDGSTLQWNQSAASVPGWTAQLTEWAANIQAAATAAGLAWFVEPRAVNNVIPTDISGDYGTTPTGLPGAPSIPVAQALIDGGMAARYVNIQICPGNPVPVSAEVVAVNDPGASTLDRDEGYPLTTAGAVLGPKQQFFVCRCCGQEGTWFLADGITKAEAGQIPNCFEPCGTLAGLDAPPDRDCTFQTLIACDNNNSELTTDFTNTITRRATVCNGEQIAVDYFQEDPNDNSALIEYTLVGDFVDCATGLPVPLPIPPCDDFASLGNLYTLENVTAGLNSIDVDLDNAGEPDVSLDAALAEIATWDIGPDGVPDPTNSGTVTATGIFPDLNVNDANNTPTLQDVQVVSGYVIVDKPTVIRYGGTAEGYQGVYIDACCATGTKTLIYERSINVGGPGLQGDAFGLLPTGIHAISVINLDVNGTNSSATFQSSDDGGTTWATFAPVVSTSKPCEVCIPAIKCIPNGSILNALTLDVIDIDTTYSCPIDCEPTATDSFADALIDCPCGAVIGIRYDNDDNTTDVNNGVGDVDNDGDQDDTKWNFEFNEDDVEPLLDFTDDCLAAGNEVTWSWVNLDGETGEQTFGPEDYTRTGTNVVIVNDVVVPSSSGKMQSLEAKCTSGHKCLPVYDACVVAKLEELIESQCRPTECVESQSYTFGLDNTGSDFRLDEVYEIGLDNGAVITLVQTPTANNTEQLNLWEAEVQAGADALGMTGWQVAATWLNNSPPSADVTNISGANGLPGASSVAAALAMDAGGMVARYLNIEVCPGSPLPISFVRVSRDGVDAVPPFQMPQAGPILGPILKYRVCACCEEAPVYYLEDGVTVAPAPPSCPVPCGTSQLTPEPEGPRCEHFLETACDTNGSVDPADWTSLTRSTILCPDEDAQITYYTDDGNGLIETLLVGMFVDCDSGNEIPVPVAACSDFELATVYRLDTSTISGALRNREWDLGPRPTQFMSVADGTLIREAFDFSAATTVDAAWPRLSVDDTNSDGTIQDAQVIEGYIVVDEPLTMRWASGSAGYFALELGKCCGPLELVLEGATADGTVNPTASIELPAGIHQIRMWNIDDWTNTARTAYYSTDGGATFTADNTPPGVAFSNAKPVEECIIAKVCKDSGDMIDLLTGDVLDPAELTACPQACTPTSGGSGSGGSSTIDGPIEIDCPAEVEETIVTGTGSVPAGFRTVTINNITGLTTVAGGFVLGTGRRVDAISLDSTNHSCINGVLPAIPITGGTWQWIGVRA